MRKHSICILVIIILYLCLCPIASAASYNAYINTKTKVYTSPSTSARSITVKKGMTVKVTAYAKGWCRIKKGGATGYIPAKYLTASTAKNIDKVLRVAMDQVGKRYGRDVPRKFDCSALVQYSFGKAGYSVKGTANDIARDNRYPKVRASQLTKGDIICMDANSDLRCDHVGIYLGKGYMVEASFTAGIVRVKKLNSWYKNHIMFLRRVS